MISQQQYYDLFIARTSCLVMDLSETDHQCGWIGGNAPAYFDDKQSMVNDADAKYYFYLALVSPINNRMISVFIPAWERYFKASIYPNCAIKVFEHEVSPESQYNHYEMFHEEPAVKKTEYEREFDYSKPVIKKTFLSNARLISTPNDEETDHFIQVGGEPNWVQGAYHYLENLERDGYQYFFSADEFGYLDDTIHGNVPFDFGAVYFYAKINKDTVSDVIAGFWQE